MPSARTFTSRIVGALLVVGATVAGTTPAGAAPPSHPTVTGTATHTSVSSPSTTAIGALYKTPSSDYLYAVTDGHLATITYEQWRDSYAFQSPIATANSYLKHSWSPTIFAVSRFPGTDEPIVGPLTYSQWQSVGFPDPTTTPLVLGSSIVKWASSNELFIRTPNAEVHKLTRAEWDATGDAPFTDHAPNGFLKLTWSPGIVFAPTISPPGAGLPIPGKILTYSEWAALGFPTPLQVQRFQQDRFQQNVGSPVISYEGPSFYNDVTYDQWVAAGSPQPILYNCDQTSCTPVPTGQGK